MDLLADAENKSDTKVLTLSDNVAKDIEPTLVSNPNNKQEVVKSNGLKGKTAKRVRKLPNELPQCPQPKSRDICEFTTTISAQDQLFKNVKDLKEIIPCVSDETTISPCEVETTTKVVGVVEKKKRARKDSSKKLDAIESSKILEEISCATMNKHSNTDDVIKTATNKKLSSTSKKIVQSASLIQTPVVQISPEIALKNKIHSDKLNLLTQELRQFEK